jgi:serine/threonine protein kinase
MNSIASVARNFSSSSLGMMMPHVPIDRNYAVLKQIGKGGFGTVYLASDTLGNHVAIKEIQVHNMDLHRINESEKEAQLLQELQHPNILRCLDFFFTSQPTSVSLVLEYCEKGTLSTFLKQEGSTPYDLIHKWTLQLVSALKYLHSEGIIHRDLKPDNILVTNGNDVKIADFGLAKIMNTIMPEQYDEYFFPMVPEYAQTACGTKNYMAPEVWNKHYDDRSDVFSLGLILYVIATQRKVTNANFYGVSLVGGEFIGITLQKDPSKINKLFKESIWRKSEFKDLRYLVEEMLTVDYQERPRSEELNYAPDMAKISSSRAMGKIGNIAVGGFAIVAGLALSYFFSKNKEDDMEEDDDDESDVHSDELSESDMEDLSCSSSSFSSSESDE